MGRQINQRATNKEGARRSAADHSKPVDRMNAQKRSSNRIRNNLGKAKNIALQEPHEIDLIYSYKLADDKNVLAIIDAVRTGISFAEFDKITSKIPFSLAEWASYLQLSERTLQRTQKGKKSFQPVQSERIVELVMLYQFGVEVFGDQESFNIWLNSKSVALGGRTPKELLDTMFGVNMVKDELGRIEHGVLA